MSYVFYFFIPPFLPSLLLNRYYLIFHLILLLFLLVYIFELLVVALWILINVLVYKNLKYINTNLILIVYKDFASL